VTAIASCVRFAKELSFFGPAAAMANVEPKLWYAQFAQVWKQSRENGIISGNDDYRKGYLLLSRGHIYTEQEYNSILQHTADVSGSIGVCFLTGKQAEIEMLKFPSRNLPALGQTYLFARNDEVPCLARYGRNGATSISISKRTLSELHGKLASVTQDVWKGKTWTGIQINKHNSLLLAYTDTQHQIEFADLLASDDDLYAAVCEKVMEALQAKCRTGANSSVVKILCLRTLDQGNKGVEFEKTVDSACLLLNVKRMLQLTRQAPSFARFKKDEHVIPLSPCRIAKLLEYQYRRDGTKAEVHSNHVQTCFELLMGNLETASRALLPVALQRATPLLIGSCGRDYRNVISMLYILRGGIMETSAFKIGRYLSVADWLHRVYCEQVREGDLPLKLVGSSYLSQALINPERCFANMSLRLPPYLSWAKSRGAGSAAGIVALLDKLGSDIVQGGGFGTKTTDQERADILLGFHFRKAVGSANLAEVCENDS
jgi:hypothetical protein